MIRWLLPKARPSRPSTLKRDEAPPQPFKERHVRISFYVALPSHANRREFPQNRSNSFKIRLSHPLHLPGGQWQVGLSAISLPGTRVNINDLVKKGDHAPSYPGSSFPLTSGRETNDPGKIRFEVRKYRTSG